MIRRLLGGFAIILLAGASGCTTVGGALGSLAPEGDRAAQLAAAVAPPERPAFVASAFCPEPIRELYMVMPEMGGRVGKVSVTFADGSELLLEGAFAAAELKAGRKSELTGDREMMDREFGSALTALPEAPLIATLYFRFGTTELSDSSRSNIDYVFKQIMAHESPEVSITGHTDTVGSIAGNQQLSVSRAERVRQKLLEMGVPADRIVAVSGKGETELLVQTADNVKEERNRRVVVTIR